MCCSVLQCVAVWLRCVAVCCSALPCIVSSCSVLQCGAVCCSVVQCVAVCVCAHLSLRKMHLFKFECVATHCSVLHCRVALCCSVPHRFAKMSPCVMLYCRVLPCVAMCCRVWPCIALCVCVRLHLSLRKTRLFKFELLLNHAIELLLLSFLQYQLIQLRGVGGTKHVYVYVCACICILHIYI